MIYDETTGDVLDLTDSKELENTQTLENNPIGFTSIDCENIQNSTLVENCVSKESLNNGGTTDYYQIDPKWKQAQDIIEDRNMNFAQGNILKSAFCFNTKRHSGTSYERELNKIIWFCERELERLKNTQFNSLEENCGIPFKAIK